MLNREIKFRAWDKERKIMDWVCNIDFYLEQASLFGERPQGGFRVGDNLDLGFSHIEFMQYTGLKDKGGIEIYESDYLKTDKGIICRVYWSKSGACFMVSYENKWSDRLGKLIYKTLRQFHKKSETIGNIYETPI